jgi:allantoate deiminase
MTRKLAFGKALMVRLDELATVSDDPERLTRHYLSPAHVRAMRQVAAWMAEAGMTTRIDAVGNVIGRYEASLPGAPALLVGSHIDTVTDAGRYDGNLGVLAGIAAVDALNRAGERLPVALEVLAFGDEEGVRFPTALTGSRAVAGTLDSDLLYARDRNGVAVHEALRDEAHCDAREYKSCAYRREDVVAYLEVHIEQGPVLEAENLPLGVVSAINGANRLAVEVQGIAGHAGTVPMALRRDALAAAAECVLEVERRCADVPELVGTVGRMEVP